MGSSGKTIGRRAWLLLPVLGCGAGWEPEADRSPPTRSEAPHRPAPIRRVDPPAGPDAMAPNLALAADGVLATWLEPSGAEQGAGRSSDFKLRMARWDGEAWSAAAELATGGDFFVNWADVPAVARAADGTLTAHWLAMLGQGTYAYGVQLARSRDGGATWERLGLLHDDASQQEHGFVSFVPVDRGIRAFWLDGRAMAGGGAGAMQLRTVLIGNDWTEAGSSRVLDDRVCECCQTDAAVTAQGPLVTYRDRDAGEIRDVTVIRADGAGWSAPAVVAADGWKIHGCPVNGPAVAADGERVAIAWFTAAAGEPRVSVAFSADAGKTFGVPLRVDAEQPLGRVDVALDPAGNAWVSWLARVDEERGEVRLRRFAPSGTAGAVEVVAATIAGRAAGVPRIARADGQLLVAWVEAGEPSRLRVAVRADG